MDLEIGRKSVLQCWEEANDFFSGDEQQEPLRNPQKALEKALEVLKKKQISSKNWKERDKGIAKILRLAKQYPDVLIQKKFEVMQAICHHIQNYVLLIRACLNALKEVILASEHFSDQEAELIFLVLQTKYGNSSRDIMKSIREILIIFMDKLSLENSALLLVKTSKKLLFKRSKELNAKLLKKTVIELGPHNILTEKGSIASKILFATADLLLVPSPVTKYYAKKIFRVLMVSCTLEHFLKKHLPPPLQSATEKVIKVLMTKGIGEKPTELNFEKQERKH